VKNDKTHQLIAASRPYAKLILVRDCLTYFSESNRAYFLKCGTIQLTKGLRSGSPPPSADKER